MLNISAGGRLLVPALLVVLAGAVLAFWASQSRAQGPASAPGAEAAPSIPSNDEGNAIPVKELPALLASASDFERQILADGVVTEEEYHGAYLAAWNCTVERTAEIDGLVIRSLEYVDGRPRFGGHSAETREALEAANEAHIACVHEYLDDVSVGYSSGAANERVQPGWNWIGQCMAKAGASVPAVDPVFPELMDASFAAVGDGSLFWDCANQVPAHLRPANQVEVGEET